MYKSYKITFLLLLVLAGTAYGARMAPEKHFSPPLPNAMRPESCNPLVIVHEDFESAPVLQLPDISGPYYFLAQNPSSQFFSDYTEWWQGAGSARIETASTTHFAVPDPSCNTPTFGGNLLFIDAQPTNASGSEPVAWGKTFDSVLPMGNNYTLSFWMISTNAFNSTEVKAYLRSTTNSSLVPILGSIANANAAINSSCGAVLQYSFTVNAIGYNQLVIIVAGNDNNGPGGYDYNIDEITLKQDLVLNEPTSAFTIAPGPYISNFPIQFTAATPSQNAGGVYSWDWGDGSPITTGVAPSHSFPQGAVRPYAVSLTVSITYPATVAYGGATCSSTTSQALPMYRPLCESTVPAINSPGEFRTNLRTGSIDFVPDGTNVNDGTNTNCLPITPLECIGRQGATTAGTVAISMTAFADSLVQGDAEYRQGASSSDPFLEGQGQLRPYATYTFQAPLTAETRNYAAGTFSGGIFSPYASARARPATWLATSVAERLSPNGDVLQERDPLGVRSVAKYGYGSWPQTNSASNHVLPYLQAHHTEASTVMFESFESTYDAPWRGEDQFLLQDSEAANAPVDAGMRAHTGAKALLLKSTGNNSYQFTLKPFPLTEQLTQEGLLVKCWLYLPGFSLTSATSVGSLGVWSVNGTSALRTTPLTLVAQTGDWCLAEAQLPLPLAASANPLTAGATLVPRLSLQRPAGTTTAQLWVDDVRMQPGKAQMTAYVYDPRTFRLLATFDDQHYALLYQYNSQGQLIRKQAETVRGVKTLQETFYHTPLQPIQTP